MEHLQPSHDSHYDPRREMEKLSALHDRDFMVKRNPDPRTGQPERFERDWVIKDIYPLSDGKLGVQLVQPEKNLAKRIRAEELLSWQPASATVEEDTLIRPHELEQPDTPGRVEAALGKAAFGNEDVFEGEAERHPDEKAAETRIGAILGKDNGGRNMLAEVLRQAGDDPSAIREALADKETHTELRETVKTVLSRRMSDLLAEGGHFHDRVQRNNPDDLKAPEGNHGYGKRKYRSDAYVVLLALAKLDGSFDTTKERNHYNDYPADHSHQGQHRQASDTLLESFIAENEPEKQEREVTDDEELLRARDVVNDMLDRLRTNNRLNYDQIEQIEDLLQYPTIDLDAVDEATDVMVARLHETYEAIQHVSDELYRIKENIDEATLSGMKRRHVFEQAAATIHHGMDVLSMEFAYQGIGMIDRLTSESRYDANMQLEYRTRVSQLLQHLKDTQQMALSIMESTEL